MSPKVAIPDHIREQIPRNVSEITKKRILNHLMKPHLEKINKAAIEEMQK